MSPGVDRGQPVRQIWKLVMAVEPEARTGCPDETTSFSLGQSAQVMTRTIATAAAPTTPIVTILSFSADPLC